MVELSSVIDFLQRIVAFIVVIGIIVFVHEFGHFIAARSVGIRVIRFSIGFPPKIFSWIRGSTEYVIGSVPVGGYVKMAGIIDETYGDEESKITGAKDEFASKNVFQKSWVLTAGVIMNFIFAWIVAIVLAISQGKAIVDEPVIGALAPNMPAATELKLIPNDRILQVNNIATPTWDVLTSVIHANGNKELSFVWLRGTDTLRGFAMSQEKELPDSTGTMKKVGLIGISPKIRYEPIGFMQGIATGHRIAYSIVKGSAQGFVQLFSGNASIKEMIGPIGIAQMSGESARSGVATFFGFMMLISISVAMINILPFPVLDGGHLAIIWIEAIIRRQIPMEVRLRIQQVGVAVLLLMVVFVSYHDIIRIMRGN